MGYRMPDEIEQEVKNYTFENYNSVRAQIDLYLKHIEDADDTNTKDQQKNDFEEAAFHPVTGGWGSHLGTGVELAFAKSGQVEIEQAQIK